jgi:FkbH-like protein
MLLKLSDISIFIANWEDKASNIRHIQKVLNIGMDSLVFVDDNPFERNLVRQMIPEITVPELPEDPALYRRFLQALNLFETSAYTKADDERTEQYKAESERVMLQQSFESIDDYLISLNIRAEAKPFDSFNIPRIAQLSQRSNQFNLRTVRYTESEIAAINADENYIDLYFTLADKFGSHGLVSAIIIKCSEKTAFIENWFMSCRVLKRSMEEFIINTAVSAARKKGINTLNAEYIPTPKNAMVKDIYEKLGFTRTNEYSFTLDTTEFQENETFVALK